MEAAVPRLVYSGPQLTRFSFSSRRSFVSSIPRRNRYRRILAVATDPKPTTVNGSSSSSASTPVNNNVSTRINDVSKEIKRVRAQMEEDEQLSVLMRGLRGQNLKDSTFADDSIQLRLVETGESSEFLPLVYDPATISAYWGKRPRAVASRVVQLLSVAGGFLSRIAGDVINKKVKENEVARAIELREIVTSLGPAYIKLGQALSIRPDILSPAAMTELQKLCDKVPSFPDDVAMALIEEELGKPPEAKTSEQNQSPMGKKKCDLCEGVARMYCESDQASLCWDCDGKVHGANFLVAKHTRCLLCTSCQSLTPWKATGLRLGPTFSVCESCVAFKSSTAAGGVVVGGSGSENEEDHRLMLGDDDGGDSAESYDDDEDEDEEYSDEDDEDVEEDEAENQVVPWSAAAAAQLPPTMSSSSSDGGDLAGKRQRDCSDDVIGSSSAQESNYSPPLKRPSREEPAFESTAAINSLNQIRRREHHIE